MSWQTGQDGVDRLPRDFVSSVRICLTKYDGFSGRAPRAEYWWYLLFIYLVLTALAVASKLVWGSILHGPGNVIRTVVGLLLFLPHVAVAVRRLHDTDRSGWWLLIALVPLVGVIVLLVWLCMRGTPGTNRFGPEVQPSSRPVVV